MPKLKAPRPIIHVTEEIISNAIRKNSGACMIANAIRQQRPDASGVSVDLQTIRFSDPEKRLRYIWITPRVAVNALIRFDRGLPIPPFSFHLRSAQIISMSKRDRIAKTERKAHRFGKRQVVVTKNDQNTGLVGETIGGRAPPKAHASRTSQRIYGMRAYTLDDVIPMPEGA